jgi:two-component system, OmpR family, sensor kinase
MFSLRWRLVAVALGVASVGLVTANIVVYGVVQKDLNTRIDRQLLDFSGRRLLFRAVDAAASGRSPFGNTPGAVVGSIPRALPAPPNDQRRPPRAAFETYAEIRDASGLLVAGPQRFSASEDGAPDPLALPESMGKPPARPQIFESNDASGKPYRVIYRELRENLKDGKAEGLVFAIPTVDRDATLSRLRLVQLIAVGATLAALALFASLLVRLGLRPLRRIENSAATIAAGNLSHRIDDVGSPRTEVGRLGASLNAMLSQIEGAFAEKDRSEAQLKRFVANASHELRTPLTSIRGYAELYQRGVGREGPGLDNSMGRIASEANRMSALVEDMLAVARLNETDTTPTEPISLASVVHDAVADHRVVDPSRPISQTITAEPWVHGNGFALMQVLTNLLGNVRVHTPEGTRIDVVLDQTATDAVLTVRDSGPGISAADLPMLFEAFYRTDPARSRANGGAGLGLTIVAGIVAKHHGTISVESNLGEHTTFTLRFPRIADESVDDESNADESFERIHAS